MKPKIVIDARMVGPVPHGFSRYVSSLAKGLRLVSESTSPGYEPVFLSCKEGPSKFFDFAVIKANSRFLNPLEILEIPLLLKSHGASLYHSPTFSSLLWAPCPWIVTVHDLNHLTYGGVVEKAYYRFLLKSFARRARKLITVSEFSKRQLSRWSDLSGDDIEVVYNAIEPLVGRYDDKTVQGIMARHGLTPGKYFFCLSNPKPHKNVELLVKAYRIYRERKAPEKCLPLVLSMTQFSDVPGIRAIGGLTDDEVGVLIKGATAMFFPSRYEGFGLPPVEAAVSGIPLAVSKIPPHEEGLVDCEASELLWVHPDDCDGWARAFDVAESGGLKGASPGTREKILHRFSVERLGEHMDRIYRSVLGI